VLTDPVCGRPSKDAEHVAEGNALHEWVVRSALPQKPGSDRWWIARA